MITIGECLQEAAAALSAAGVENAALDAEVLIGHFCGMERYQVKAYPEREVKSDQYEKIADAVARRSSFEPVAYITGKKEFYSLEFSVNRDVLIPRPETELLVDLASYYIPMNGKALDLCTGCGCIAVAVKHSRSDADITASDISQRALVVAKKNAEAILGKNKLRFAEGDLFEPVSGKVFDCIICNPPYVDTALKKSLQPDLAFEPPEALFCGEEGRELAGKIISRCGNFLSGGGVLIMEIGEAMADFVRQAGEKAGFSVSVMNDYGGLPRAAVFKGHS